MKDFLASDYCTQCGGKGYRIEKTFLLSGSDRREYELEQCESCEELHHQEVRADRLMDEMKGN